MRGQGFLTKSQGRYRQSTSAPPFDHHHPNHDNELLQWQPLSAAESHDQLVRQWRPAHSAIDYVLLAAIAWRRPSPWEDSAPGWHDSVARVAADIQAEYF